MDIIRRLAAEHVVTAEEFAEKQVFALAEEILVVKTTHVQEQLVRSNEAETWKVQRIGAQKSVGDTKYKRYGAKVRLQLLKREQQRYQAAVSWMKSKVASPDNAHVQNRKILDLLARVQP